MKEIYKILLPTLLFAGTIAPPAVMADEASVPAGYIEQSDYTEGFEYVFTSSGWGSATVDITKYEGWNRLTDYNSYGSTPVSYTSASSYAHGGSRCLGVSTYQSDRYDAGNYRDFNDLVISPLVKGEISFYGRRSSTSSTSLPSLKIYEVTQDENGKFVQGDELADFTENLTALTDYYTWSEALTYDLGDEYKYVGVRMEYCYIDDFSASSALIPENRSMQLGDITRESTKINQNEDGTVTYPGSITVSNTGNVTLNPGDENFTVIVKDASSPNDVYKVIEIPEALEPGASTTVDVTVTVPLQENASLRSDFCYYQGIRCVPGMIAGTTETSTEYKVAWYTIVPQKAIMSIYDSSKTIYKSTSIVDFGFSEAQSESKTYYIRNNGLVSFEVSGVEVPEGVSVSFGEGVDFPISVEPGSENDVAFTMCVSGEPGVYSGAITFAIGDDVIAVDDDSNPTNVVNVNGAIYKEGGYFESFEGRSIPSGWYRSSDSGWSVSSLNSKVSSTGNSYALSNSSQFASGADSGTSIISPKISFSAGEKFNFYAGTASSYKQEGINLYVYYSADRENWNVLGRLVSADSKLETYPDAIQIPNVQYTMSGYSFAMPEGEYYIRFEAGYMIVDNIFGGELVDVDVDVIPVSLSVGSDKVVNHDVTVTATFSNLLESSIEENSYSVTLFENDVEVAKAEASAFGHVNKSFSFVYMPHNVGENVLKAVFAINDSEYSVSTDEYSVSYNQETVSDNVQIGGEATSSNTSSNVPYYYNYKNSRSEVIYLADEINKEGGKILSIAYPYYRTNDKTDYNTHVRIWMENTDATTVSKADGFSDTDNMTLVYDNENQTSIPYAGSYSNFVNVEYLLSEGFDYTGGNLRVVVESDGDSFVSVTFAGYSPEDSSRKTIYAYSDTSSDFATLSKNESAKLPIIILGFEKILEPSTGKVVLIKGESQKPIEGASVKAEYALENGSVIYESETDEEGNFSLLIYRDDLAEEGETVYTLTVSKEGYEPYVGTITAGEQGLLVSMEQSFPLTLYVKGDCRLPVYRADGVSGESEAILLDVVGDGLYASENIKFYVQDGEEFAHIYFAEYDDEDDPGRVYGASEEGAVEIQNMGMFELVEDGANFDVLPSTTKIQVDLKNMKFIVCEMTGVNTVYDLRQVSTNVYRIDGVLVRKNVDSEGALKDLPAGIYISNGKKVIVK